MRTLCAILACISVVSCKPQNANTANTNTSGSGPIGRGSTVKANVGTYYSVAGNVVNIVEEQTAEGLQMIEAYSKGAEQSKSRYAISWTSQDAEKLTGTLFAMEGTGLRECGPVFFMLQGKPALHNPGAKCGLAQDYAALGAMASAYYTTGETLSVTDVYEGGMQMIEHFRNSSQQSKTRFKAMWLNMNADGNMIGRIVGENGTQTCGSIIYVPKSGTVAFDTKNPCGLSNFYTLQSRQ